MASVENESPLCPLRTHQKPLFGDQTILQRFSSPSFTHALRSWISFIYAMNASQRSLDITFASLFACRSRESNSKHLEYLLIQHSPSLIGFCSQYSSHDIGLSLESYHWRKTISRCFHMPAPDFVADQSNAPQMKYSS